MQAGKNYRLLVLLVLVTKTSAPKTIPYFAVALSVLLFRYRNYLGRMENILYYYKSTEDARVDLIPQIDT